MFNVLVQILSVLVLSTVSGGSKWVSEVDGAAAACANRQLAVPTAQTSIK